MRIVHVMPFAPPATQFGGPVHQADLVCPELARRGHEVMLVGSDMGIDPDVPREQWLPRKGYRVWYGRTRPWHRVAPYWQPSVKRGLASALPADVVHLQLALTLVNVLACRWAQRAGIPIVYSPRGSLSLNPRRLAGKRWSKTLFVRLFERRLLRSATMLHALSEDERAHLLYLGAAAERIVLIPNGVAPPALPADAIAARVHARRQLGLDGDSVVSLFLGQVHPIKGLDLLLPALANVVARTPKLRLAIAGPDAGAEVSTRQLALRLGIADRLHWLGHVSGARKTACFLAADFFVLTSYSEGLPNAVLEALAHGLPVLITDQCHLPEITAGAAGIVTPCEITAISTALQALATNPALRAAMSDGALNLVASRFSLERTVDQIEALYRQVASSGVKAGSP